MITQLIFLCFAMLLMAAILLHPAVCVAGAASGLMIWFNSALPSLFPFMVLTGLIIRMNTLETISRSLRQNRWFRHMPIPFIFAALTGLLCGYPMGVRTASELRESGQISKNQAALLLAFVNQPGPMFILGYAMPLCEMDRSTSTSFLLAFYGSVLLTALASGLTAKYSELFHGRKRNTANCMSAPIQPSPPEKRTFFTLFEDTILSSMMTLTKIGGYMMLFSLFLALLKELINVPSDVLMILGGLLEMTSGIAGATTSGETCAPYLVLGFLSFGGLCVTAQSFSLGKLETGEQLRYLLWKTVQTVIAIGLFHLMNISFSV